MPDIILDRDGVINIESPNYIRSPDEWQAIPGSLQAIAQLNQAGYRIFIVTNQSGVARGYYSLDTLYAIHQKLRDELDKLGGRVEDIFFCPHHPSEYCLCRKPKPGMLFQLQAKHQVILKDAFFVGDSYVDVQAAQSVACTPVLVMTGNGIKTLLHHPECHALLRFANLAQAAEYFIRL